MAYKKFKCACGTTQSRTNKHAVKFVNKPTKMVHMKRGKK